MKIALCFSGQVRDFLVTKRSFQRLILSQLRGHDLYFFAHYPSADGIDPARLGLTFSDVLIEDESKVVSPLPVQGRHQVESRKWHKGNSFRSFYLQLRSLYFANWLRQTFEERNGFLFDWVFRCRFESLFFGEKLEDLERLDPRNIYIPRHDNHYGFNDRFAFGAGELMDVYSSRYNHFASYEEQANGMHPELFLKWVLDRSLVRVDRTRVSCHLLRYGHLYRAYYSKESGDVLSEPRNLLGKLGNRLLLTRYAPLLNRLYIAKERYLG